ncbi:hypothetical protein K502DRAFT_325592 [Neoconidiobolus thromboides FSU 785]|nr:hypothetical protein K502DRAFT_325592 [Neoconidiobolus thromboides FSU 785]
MDIKVIKTSNEVSLESTKKYDLISIKERIQQNDSFKKNKFEAFDQSNIIQHNKHPYLSLNGFAETIHLAYDQHHGLTLAPHHLWIVILQALAIHVNLNGEKYKQTLGIQHSGQENIDIRRDNFILGGNNNWQQLFPEFVDIINTKVSNDLSSLLNKPFSTSDELAIAVTSLTIMDLYKNYFTYSVTTRCGIPEISLLGTIEDWKDLLQRSQTLLSKFEDLKFWKKELIPVLNQFIQAKQDTIDNDFWTKLYKPEGGSGGPFISGWINVFYPYLQSDNEYIKNDFMNWKEEGNMFSGTTYNQIPAGFTKTPFVWNYHAEKFQMNFIAGFLGAKKSTIKQDHIEPAISWFINYQ